jgi:hypothetical protein
VQWVFAFALGGQFKHFVDELILRPNISAAHPSNLSLAQYVDCFVTLNRSSRSPKFSESALGVHSSFYGSMLFKYCTGRCPHHGGSAPSFLTAEIAEG